MTDAPRWTWPPRQPAIPLAFHPDATSAELIPNGDDWLLWYRGGSGGASADVISRQRVGDDITDALVADGIIDYVSSLLSHYGYAATPAAVTGSPLAVATWDLVPWKSWTTHVPEYGLTFTLRYGPAGDTGMMWALDKRGQNEPVATMAQPQAPVQRSELADWLVTFVDPSTAAALAKGFDRRFPGTFAP